MRWRLVVVVALALALGFVTLATTARVGGNEPRRAAVAVEHAQAPPRVVAVFIDSLAREVATDPVRMPSLARMAAEGAAFDVEPCRDQLTYLCLRAAFTGHDESSLLAIADNFRPRHEGPPDTLFSALAAQGRRTVVIGTEDFHPYRRYLHSERRLTKREETEVKVLAELRAAADERASLTVISLGSGDMAAHAHGTASAEYRAAFARLDRVVAAVAAALEPDVHLLVFGDHGHDREGRHLPGTASRTWALYRGRAFRAGSTAELRLTDHRALLGVLLGVPTEPIYGGPPLSQVLSPDWVAQQLPAGLPPLGLAQNAVRRTVLSPWRAVVLVALATAALGLGGGRVRAARRWWWAGAAGVGLASVVGARLDFLRSVVHDHGGEAERGAWLLVPLALALGLALRRRQPLLVLAASSLLICLLLLPPTAYYYGARRAIVLAGVIALCAVGFDRLRHAAERWRAALALTFVAVTLLSFYPVRQLGPETAGASAWALDAAIYTQAAWAPLVVAKLVLYAIALAPRAPAHPLDSASGALLLLLCLVLQLIGFEPPRSVLALALAGLIVGGLVLRKRAAGVLTGTALISLTYLYGCDRARLAPLEMLLSATALASWTWPRLGLSTSSCGVATGLTVAVASYLMLWPTVGFHLVGIDFAYVFRWIPPEHYERAWLLIALAVIFKLTLPFVLLMGLGRPRLRVDLAGGILLVTLTGKVLLLCVMIVSHAASTDMRSQQALAMLAELCLVMFVSCVAAAAAFAWAAGTEPGGASLRPDY